MTRKPKHADRGGGVSPVEASEEYVVILLDEHGMITGWNTVAERVFGYSRSEAVGRHFSIIFTEQDRESGIPEQELRLALKSGRAPDQRWHRRKDGTRFWVDGIVSVKRKKDGTIESIAKILRDMSIYKEVAPSKSLHELEAKQQLEDVRILPEAIPQMVWTARPDGWIDYHNQRWFDFTGKSMAETQGWGWISVLHPDDQDAVTALWKKSVATAQPYEVQFRCRRHDGVFRWQLSRASALLDKKNKVVKWFGTCTDIESQKNSERKHQILADAGAVLSESVDYETALQAVAHLIVPDIADWCTIDFIGDDKVIRPIAAAHADPSRAGLVHKIHSCFPPDVNAAHGVPHVINVRQPELVSEVTHEFLSAIAISDEHLKLLKRLELQSYLAVPVRARGRAFGAIALGSSQPGRHYGIEDVRLAEELARRVAVTIDNSRLYQDAQREIAERSRIQDELAEADRRKDEFLATLAHELRNPMAPIRQAMHVIRMFSTSDPSVNRAREIVERQVVHMSRLVEDLLDVSRMQRGLIALRKERLNLNTVLEHSIESASAIVGAHGHHVDVSCTPEPMFIDADATRIEQVLVNLLSNAAKYTPRGGQIRIATANENGRAVIRVRDTGIGIAPELLPRIFELFTQGNRSLDRADGGLGIGLTLVRHLVEMHGGTISAHSEGPGKGSEFVVNLPLSETKAAPEKPASRRRHPTGALAFRKVLIVEDNDDSRDTLQTILELWGHKTLVARNGVEGLELALHEQPEIGLIDVGLPGMNGYELAKGIRSGLGKSMFLVALTGYGQPEDRKRAFESGFDSHLVKPADLDELARIIGAAPSVGAHT